MKKIPWGVLSTARIGLQKVIPAMQKGKYSAITAIASRDREKAQNAAKNLGIPKAYGAYEDLLTDGDIEAIYIPLPNHLHVEWTLKALAAGKHVLCEKPIGVNLQEAEDLQKAVAKYPHLKVMEAFMYRHHPQMQKTKQLIKSGMIGELKNIHASFSYYNVNPNDIRNKPEIGGGGLLDIGCYCISIARFLFDSEPRRVCGTIEYDPQLKTDRLVSAVLEFATGTSTFTCSTQMATHQRAEIFGSKGKIEIENPFTPPPDKSTRIILHNGGETKKLDFAACDHYTIQGDLLSDAILQNTTVPTPLADGVANLRVIERIFASAQKGTFVEV